MNQRLPPRTNSLFPNVWSPVKRVCGVFQYHPVEISDQTWPCSKVIVKFLTVMMKHGYIGEFEIVDDHRAGKIVVNLTGRLNKCGVISPRFDVGITGIEKWTNNLLPSRQFGYVVLTTSGGIMDHEEARRKHLGGKILGFFF
ncbi:Hypothetical predicted protein [Cloeon dipterum]|uniref:40S ribosomal protein S15a n=1 Tax=Cloeon dipterum TaxID=197152 RepID=A0A8S1CSI2_9INSE|nr:Hypothetical predicted protein [Cloeon dipterum]